MPVHYAIDCHENVIRTTCSGYVTFPEVCEHFRELNQDPQFVDALDVLLDLSPCTSVPTAEQLRGVVGQISALGGQRHFGLGAIVVHNDELFGMIRAFEVYASPVFAGTDIFRSRAEAEQWLAAQREAKKRAAVDERHVSPRKPFC